MTDKTKKVVKVGSRKNEEENKLGRIETMDIDKVTFSSTLENAFICFCIGISVLAQRQPFQLCLV